MNGYKWSIYGSYIIGLANISATAKADSRSLVKYNGSMQSQICPYRP